MSVIRTVHARDYTVVDNALIRDTNLSLKAKGLALIMLSLPDDWRFTEKWLSSQSADGISVYKSAIAELEEKGYLVRKQIKDERGKFGANDYTLYEVPITENPLAENPLTENVTQLNTKVLNTEEISTKAKNIKHKYGQFKHVMLTDDEFNKIRDAFPNDWKERIDKLDEGIELKGYRYKNHYLAILKWARNEAQWVKAEAKTKQSEYDRFMAGLQEMYDEAVRNGE